MIKSCKQQYKKKIEKQFSHGDLRYAWSGLKNTIGANKKCQDIDTDNCLQFANDLNDYYCQFEVHDFSVYKQQTIGHQWIYLQ